MAPFGRQAVDATEVQFASLVSTHLQGPIFLTQKLLPLIANAGRILNVSSGFVRFTLPGYSLYAAMKAAVEVLSRYLAVELSEPRIRVNAIALGAIATDFGGGAVRDNESVNAFVAQGIALGRVGLPDDIRRRGGRHPVGRYGLGQWHHVRHLGRTIALRPLQPPQGDHMSKRNDQAKQLAEHYVEVLSDWATVTTRPEAATLRQEMGMVAEEGLEPPTRGL